MRTNFNLRFAGILLTLILTTELAFSGNDYFGRGRNRGANAVCVNRISGLTDAQNDQINNLRDNHQKLMDELHNQRRSTTDLAQKDQIRKQMDAEVATHRNAVRTLLTVDQQSQYDQFGRNGCGQFGRNRNGQLAQNGNRPRCGNGQGRQLRGGENAACSGRGFGRFRN